MTPTPPWSEPRTAIVTGGGSGIGLAISRRLADDGIPVVEEWDEPDYVSVKCSDPDGYVVEAAWEPDRRGPIADT